MFAVILKAGISLISRKTYYLGLGHSKSKFAQSINYFISFLGGKNIENCPPSKLILFIFMVCTRVEGVQYLWEILWKIKGLNYIKKKAETEIIR